MALEFESVSSSFVIPKLVLNHGRRNRPAWISRMCETHGTPLGTATKMLVIPGEYTQNARFGAILAIFSPVADINDGLCRFCAVQH